MPNQAEVKITVFQGESRDAQENIQIGEFRVVGLSRSSPGNEIVVDLALDRDGILQVTAREKRTGLQQRIVIDQALARLGETGMAEARERVRTGVGPEDRARGGRIADNGDAPARVRRPRNRQPPAEALAAAPSHPGGLDPSEAARAIARRLRTSYCPAGKERKSWQKKGPRKTAARV
jgi:hypothetical protein